MTAIRETLKSVAPLQRAVRGTRKGANDLACAMTERMIARRKGYDILVLLGMRRSGNHLAINWILGQTDGPAAFFNNIRSDAHPYDVGMREYRLRGGSRPKIVLSYEDKSLDDIRHGPLKSYLAERVARDDARVQVGLILRDPYNLFASRLKKWPELFTSQPDITAQVDMYLGHARLAREAADTLGAGAPVPILYNRLVADAVYRTELAAQLGISDGTRGLDEVPVYGHGSSFDGYDTDGAQVQASVFDRWKSSLDDPRFRAVIARSDLRDAAQTLFGLPSPLSEDKE